MTHHCLLSPRYQSCGCNPAGQWMFFGCTWRLCWWRPSQNPSLDTCIRWAGSWKWCRFWTLNRRSWRIQCLGCHLFTRLFFRWASLILFGSAGMWERGRREERQSSIFWCLLSSNLMSLYQTHRLHRGWQKAWSNLRNRSCKARVRRSPLSGRFIRQHFDSRHSVSQYSQTWLRYSSWA